MIAINNPLKKFALPFVTLFLAISANAQLRPVLEWQKTYGGSIDETAFSIKQGVNGDYIIGGSTSSPDSDVTGNHGFGDAWVVDINNTGHINWEKCLGGSSRDAAHCVLALSDGYMMAGSSASSNGDLTHNHGGYEDAWIVKLSFSGSIVWQKTFGGTGDDNAISIVKANGGGYIFTGYTNSNDGDVSGLHSPASGQEDVWVVKMDDTGRIEWQKCLGGSGEEQGTCIQNTADGGYIIVGSTNSNDGDVVGLHDSTDIWVAKLTSTGALSWQKCLGGSKDEFSYFIQQTTDLGYIVAGNTASVDGDVTYNHGGSDLWLVKLTPIGNISWQKTYGGSGSEGAFSVKQCTDKGYIAVGNTTSTDGDVTGLHTNSPQTIDEWVIRTDSAGGLVWQKCLGSKDNDCAYDVLQIADSDFITAGAAQFGDGDVTNYKGGAFDYWVVQLKEKDVTGIAITPNPSNTDIYPNPFIDQITIQNATGFNAMLTDVCGKTIVATTINSQKQTLQIPAIPPGIYYLNLKNQYGTRVFKLLKE